MYQYVWDAETGGLLLTTEVSKFSKEPRPVYYEELDILGFDQYWDYPKDDHAPLMWAEANNYIYMGRTVARTKGGSLYTRPELEILESPEPDGNPLQFVNVEAMCKKNSLLMENIVQETIQNIYNTYKRFEKKINAFYVAFSGGKDSVVVLDLVQRALPHNKFFVMFGNTRMEFPETYDVIKKVSSLCAEKGISFYQAKSELYPSDTWRLFGPPATAIRWCCSVHKTAPQINLLKEITGKPDFTGMAFTGIRAEESVSRSSYDQISKDKKHSGQYSCHAILGWGTAELFLYIFSRNLILNKAYCSGNVRVGCLVCPNSTGKHDFIKRYCYKEKVDSFLNIISSTSAKTQYSEDEMRTFIDDGFWRTRRSGKSLNFGEDLFESDFKAVPPRITVYQNNFIWQEWAKTIGDIAQVSETSYTIRCGSKLFQVNIKKTDREIIFIFENCGTGKDDTHFFSLFRSAVIKSLYCVNCRECEAECAYNCIDMSDGVKISNKCVHCHKCHDILGHCLRYNSIRHTFSGGLTMAGKKISGYDGHGPRGEWLDLYVKYDGKAEFWNSDGDGKVRNKKKEKFRDFLKDAEIVVYDKSAPGDKFTKCLPTTLSSIICREGAYSETSWGLILSNLVYTADYYWYVMNLDFGKEYTVDSMKMLLAEAMPNDASGHGKTNMVDALKIALCKTPLGANRIFCEADIDVKTNASGNETMTLKSLKRCSWEKPVPEVILYSLYKFSEACGNIKQFSLASLLDDSIERDGVSPTRIFGLDRDMMVRILNGLSMNYPDFINASFTLGLDSITLRDDKTSADVLTLF